MSKQSEIGNEEDSVSLELGGERIRVYENYEVACSIFTQPATFALRLGTGNNVAHLIERYPPHTPFRLFIGDSLIQTGWTDGFDVNSGGGITSMTLRGRDALAPLHDGFALAETSFAGVTYRQLVLEALMAVGLVKTDPAKSSDKKKVVDEADAAEKLKSSDIANRMAIAATKKTGKTHVEFVIDPVTGLEDDKTVGPKVIDHTVYVHISDRWYDFLNERISRAGLFLWAAADGTFVLSSPDRKMAPLYKVTRRRGQTRDDVNVISAHYKNDITRRYTHCKVYARGGGKKAGVAKSLGEFEDFQLSQTYGMGRSKPLVIRDIDAKDRATGDYHARRRLAEAARSGWALGYTFAGHKAPTTTGGMGVWTPNMMVEVDDEEFGLKGIYWIESVTYRRSPETTTEVVLMDPEHLIFSNLDFPDGKDR